MGDGFFGENVLPEFLVKNSFVFSSHRDRLIGNNGKIWFPIRRIMF